MSNIISDEPILPNYSVTCYDTNARDVQASPFRSLYYIGIAIGFLRGMNEEEPNYRCWECYKCRYPKNPRPMGKLGKCSTSNRTKSYETLISCVMLGVIQLRDTYLLKST